MDNNSRKCDNSTSLCGHFPVPITNILKTLSIHSEEEGKSRLTLGAIFIVVCGGGAAAAAVWGFCLVFCDTGGQMLSKCSTPTMLPFLYGWYSCMDSVLSALSQTLSGMALSL